MVIDQANTDEMSSVRGSLFRLSGIEEWLQSGNHVEKRLPGGLRKRLDQYNFSVMYFVIYCGWLRQLCKIIWGVFAPGINILRVINVRPFAPTDFYMS